MARNIAGFRTARFTPERVLQEKGLTGRASVADLARASAPHDGVNKGYLSTTELRKGADDLAESLPQRGAVDGFRFFLQFARRCSVLRAAPQQRVPAPL